MIYTRSGAAIRIAAARSRAGFPQGVSIQRLDSVTSIPIYIGCVRNRGGTRSRGVIHSASTNRPDCQRSRCRQQSEGPKNSRELRPARCCDILNITAEYGADPELSPKPGLLFANHPYRFPKPFAWETMAHLTRSPFRKSHVSHCRTIGNRHFAKRNSAPKHTPEHDLPHAPHIRTGIRFANRS